MYLNFIKYIFLRKGKLVDYCILIVVKVVDFSDILIWENYVMVCCVFCLWYVYSL